MCATILFAAGALFGMYGNVLAQDRPVAKRTEVGAIQPVSREISDRYARFQRFLQPSAKSWVESQARAQLQRKDLDLPALELAIRARFGRPGLGVNSGASTQPSAGAASASFSGMDIEAMVFIVLMEATNDQEQDLQAGMNEMQAETKAKAELRSELEAMNAEMAAIDKQKLNSPCATPRCASIVQGLRQIQASAATTKHPLRYNISGNITYGQLGQLHRQVQADSNSMDDLSDMTSMQLQMQMDQRSKLLQTLSNLMKTVSDTSDAIVQNMK